MSNLDGVTLFFTGVRISVLVMLIVVLRNSIKAQAIDQKDLYTKIAHNPKVILTLVVVLLIASTIQVSVELVNRW